METHQEIGFNTLSFLIPHISSTIRDNSSVSFACALTHYSLSGFIPDFTLTVYLLYTYIGSIIRGQNFPDLMCNNTMKTDLLGISNLKSSSLVLSVCLCLCYGQISSSRYHSASKKQSCFDNKYRF